MAENNEPDQSLLGEGDTAVAAQGPATRPVVMPDSYNGDGQFKDWLANFELCAELNGWTGETRRKFLIVRLRGHAQELYNSFDDMTRGDYRLLTNVC